MNRRHYVTGHQGRHLRFRLHIGNVLWGHLFCRLRRTTAT